MPANAPAAAQSALNLRFIARTHDGEEVSSEPLGLAAEADAGDVKISAAYWGHEHYAQGGKAFAFASLHFGEGVRVKFRIRRQGGSDDEASLQATVAGDVAAVEWTVPDDVPPGTKLSFVAEAGERSATAPECIVVGRPERIRIELQIDPDDPDTYDDLVKLTGSDGYESELGVVAEGIKHAHRKGMTALVFEGVRVGVRYTCTVDPGPSGKPYALFHDRELKPEDVLPRSSAG